MNDAIIPASCLSQAVMRIEREPGVAAAYLLGSAARGRLHPESDIDIALLPASGVEMPLPDRLDLAADLESVLGRVVDLGMLSTHNLVYAKEVAAHGELLFTRSRFVSDSFIAHALAMYADLQRSRKEVLEAYAA